MKPILTTAALSLCLAGAPAAFADQQTPQMDIETLEVRVSTVSEAGADQTVFLLLAGMVILTALQAALPPV